jgi:hypothetical protein
VHSVAEVFGSLSDIRSLDLFNSITSENISSIELRNKSVLTRKQYYSRLASMINAGLVKRKSGKLVLTAFGRVVNEARKTIEIAGKNEWRLRVIDSVQQSDEIPHEEWKKLLENLIDDKDIRDILVSAFETKNRKASIQ